MRAGRLGSRHSILFPLVAAVAALAPLFAHAADSAQKVARVAFISPYSPAITAPLVPSSSGRVCGSWGGYRGQNLIVETRYAEGAIDRLPAIVADVVALKVDVIVTRGTPAAIAAKNATTEIPIVAASVGDPVGTRLVASLARPGGNLTGLSLQGTVEFYGKCLERLGETVPRLSAVAVISSSTRSTRSWSKARSRRKRPSAPPPTYPSSWRSSLTRSDRAWSPTWPILGAASTSAPSECNS
jgi:hypothetical protein